MYSTVEQIFQPASNSLIGVFEETLDVMLSVLGWTQLQRYFSIFPQSLAVRAVFNLPKIELNNILQAPTKALEVD